MAKYLDLSGLETLWGHITSKLSTKADKNGSNATGTWGISISGSSASCTGNAATATKDGNGNTITSTYATKSELNDVSTLVGDTAVSTQITNAIAAKTNQELKTTSSPTFNVVTANKIVGAVYS